MFLSTSEVGGKHGDFVSGFNPSLEDFASEDFRSSHLWVEPTSPVENQDL